MNLRATPHYRWLLAVVSGVAMALSFPKPGWAGLAWVAPTGILFAAAGLSGASAFRVGCLAGLARQLTSLGWLLYIPFPVGNVAGWLSLSAYLALFQGLWVWSCWQAIPGRSRRPQTTWLQALDALLDQPILYRLSWTLLCAVHWVTLEMLQTRLLSGFPWNLAGTSQYAVLPLIQIAATTGIYGISFVVVWTSIALGLALLRLTRQPQNRWSCLSEIRLPLLFVVGIGCLGMLRLGRTQPEPPGIKIALIQPSIPQELIWDEAQDAERFSQVMHLTKLALATDPDLLIWPESAFVGATEERYREVVAMVRQHGTWMILSAEDAERHLDTQGQPVDDYFNAAFLLDTQGRLQATYRKQRLVIFGEYVPLSRWLPFLRHLTPIGEGFTAGQAPVDFVLSNRKLAASVLICFEDGFPHGVRDHVRDNVRLLVNLTNNGWFGNSSAQWQHAASAVFRSIENNVPTVRATNNGLTCWIDSSGRIRQWLGQDNGDIYSPGFLTATVPIPPGERRVTFYNRYGDVFGWGCVGMSLVAWLGAIRQRQR